MTEEMVTTPEAGRRLGITGRESHDLIFAGELDGKPDSTGQVKIAASEIERYRTAHLEATHGGHPRT